MTFFKLSLRLILVLTFMSVPVHSQTSEPTAAPVDDNRLKQFLSHLTSFSADFEQTLFNEFDVELEKSSGKVTLLRPGKFHWEYIQPYSQFLISDGKDMWIYDKDLQQVTVSAISTSIEKSPASLLAGDTDLGDDYIINDMGTLDGADWVELASSDPESQYNSIRLGFNGEQLSGMVLFDNLGQTTRIVFKDNHRNEPVDTSLFDFKPPAGVDVIDNRE